MHVSCTCRVAALLLLLFFPLVIAFIFSRCVRSVVAVFRDFLIETSNLFHFFPVFLGWSSNRGDIKPLPGIYQSERFAS